MHLNVYLAPYILGIFLAVTGTHAERYMNQNIFVVLFNRKKKGKNLNEYMRKISIFCLCGYIE